MERLYGWALKLIIILILVATLVSFGESYDGNFQWADTHGVTGFWADVWPLMIDLIILIGEAALFAGHYKKWRVRDRVWSWSVTLVAVAVSTSANTGHVLSRDWLSHLTAALPPVALMFCVTVGFGVMKRVHGNQPGPSQKPSQPAALTPTETPVRPLTETVSYPETVFTETRTETVSQAETASDESVATGIPESLSTTETFVNPGFKVTSKSYTLPRDPRTEITLTEKRVRDMVDVDPDITTNAVAKALGIAWATAKKYQDATMEARQVTA